MLLHGRGLHEDRWKEVLAEALHAVRSLVCLATNETHHERLFRFPRRSINGMVLPSWLLTPGTVLLRRHVRNKGDPIAIQWSLWKGVPLIRLCVYRMAEKAQSLLPIWLRALLLMTTARTHQPLTPPSRKVTVWAASTWEMYQRTKLTAYEVKDKMTKALFQRSLLSMTLSLNRLCRAGLPVDANPLIGMVLMSLQFEWGWLWRFVCCCLALTLFRRGTLIAATTARGSLRLYFTASVERAFLLLSLLCVLDTGLCFCRWRLRFYVNESLAY